MTLQNNERRAFLRTAGATVALAATAGCLGGEDGSPRTIEMNEMSFIPSSTSVTAGSKVRWKNTTDVKHTVTAYEKKIPEDAAYFASGEFDSEQTARNNLTEGLIAPGETYKYTFEVTGAYEYFCIPHESSGMVGTVRVK